MKTKVLIVDDLKENIRALEMLLASDEIEVFSAENPETALSHLIDHTFGLALLDVQMPTMTGFELARLIRGVERTRHLPIIFVTAHASESSLIFEGYESGAVDLLFKPLDPHIVRSKVQVFVRLDQQSRQLAAQVETMARLKEAAETANIAKSRFLANMSHEIRTPLSAVLGFADILSQSDLPPKDRQECLSSISRNGKLLLRIIDDILDLSRIEAQRLELERTDLDIGDLVRDLETTLAGKAAEKGIELEFVKSPQAVGKYFTDPLRLKQILLNVIGNAIKFTHDGHVRVEVDVGSKPVLIDDSRAFCEIKFRIEDSGIGLSKEEAARLFEPFAQADSSTRRKYGGTGLGLAISKQLARSLGGDVVLVNSRPGVGSIFEISICAPPTENQIQKASADAAAKATAVDVNTLVGKRILVVDDVPDNRVLIERYLRPTGVEVDQAPGGKEALERATPSAWDAVLMDIQMPNMDGYEVTARLRQMGFSRPIIALTAHAMREELEKCLKAGCDLTLTKPVTKDELIHRLAEAIGSN